MMDSRVAIDALWKKECCSVWLGLGCLWVVDVEKVSGVKGGRTVVSCKL